MLQHPSTVLSAARSRRGQKGSLLTPRSRARDFATLSPLPGATPFGRLGRDVAGLVGNKGPLLTSGPKRRSVLERRRGRTTMNGWFRHPHAKAGELAAFEAETLEREGDLETSRERWASAARSFAMLALRVPASHPNTRSDFAIAATASFARAREFHRAIDFALRVLAESGALTEDGRRELREMVSSFGSSVKQGPPQARGAIVRAEVRAWFVREPRDPHRWVASFLERVARATL